MATTYKRTIIQIPLEDVKAFEDYANKYGLSFSSSIVMLAKKSIENEQLVSMMPQMIDFIKSARKESVKKRKNK